MPVAGCRHDLAASNSSAAYSSFGAGGEASKGPMIEKRRRAQRSGGAFWLSLAEHALCFEVTPDRGVGWNRCFAALECGAQVVEMQLHRPARMFAILEGERINNQLRQTWKAADLTAQAILEGCHRIVGTTCGVIPALHRRGRETNIHAGRGMSPRLGGEQF